MLTYRTISVNLVILYEQLNTELTSAKDLLTATTNIQHDINLQIAELSATHIRITDQQTQPIIQAFKFLHSILPITQDTQTSSSPSLNVLTIPDFSDIIPHTSPTPPPSSATSSAAQQTATLTALLKALYKEKFLPQNNRSNSTQTQQPQTTMPHPTPLPHTHPNTLPTTKQNYILWYRICLYIDYPDSSYTYF